MEYIDKIIENGNIDDMHELSAILEELLCEIEKNDEELYKEYKMELYEMAYGKKLTEKLAKEIVNKMQPLGERWSLEETTDIQSHFGAKAIDSIDFYIVMNSAYNDYKDIFQDNIESYVRFTFDFIRDEDAKDDKVYLYFTTLV